MQPTEQTVATRQRNWLLRALPPQEFELVSQHLEAFPLRTGHVVIEVNTPTQHVYFPDNGVISSLSVMADGSAVETATIGPEGMAGIAIFHGVDEIPERAIEYRRGVVTVLDREALERAACECYGIIRSTFDRLLGDGETPNPLAGIKLSKAGRTIAKDGTPQAPPGEGPNALRRRPRSGTLDERLGPA